MTPRILLLVAFLGLGLPCILAAAPAEPTYKILPGPMPRLPGQTSGSGGPDTKAPVPNYDLDAPHARADGTARLEPGVTDRERRRPDQDSFAPDSGFSSSLERKSRALNGIGNTLAPSVILRVPLQ